LVSTIKYIWGFFQSNREIVPSISISFVVSNMTWL